MDELVIYALVVAAVGFVHSWRQHSLIMMSIRIIHWSDLMVEKMVQSDNVNSVLDLVKSQTEDGNLQLSTLALAYVVGCQACGIPKEMAISCLVEYFDEQLELVSTTEH